MTEKRPLIGYIRVSKEDQAEGASLDTQEAKLRAWATLYDYELVRVYRDEGISGRTLRKRPQARAAIAEACRLRCPIVFYSLTRMIRNIKEAIQLLEDLERVGASLASVEQKYDTSTVGGWDRYIIDAWLAEREVRVISERTTHVLRHAKANGQRTGGIPYGYEPDTSRPVTKTRKGRIETYYPHLVEIPAEQAILARIYAMHAAGVCPQHIADRLNTENIPTKTRRGEWGRSAICRILARP